MITCPLCQKDVKDLIIHISKKEDQEHTDLHQNLLKRVDYYLLETELYLKEISPALEKEFSFPVSIDVIRVRESMICPGRSLSVMGKRRLGKNNPVYKNGVIDKISQTVKKCWEVGDYADRINGMLGLDGEKHHNYKLENHTPTFLAEHDYVTFLSYFEDVTTCRRCGRSDIKINVHHLDEDHKNFLPSNLVPLCVPHHLAMHYKAQKSPTINVCRFFEFDSSHYLPDYDGKCQRNHGHRWRGSVSIKLPIDKETSMVMDFHDLQGTIDQQIVDILDHRCINDFLRMPTAENMTVWMWERLMFYGQLKGLEEISLWETPDSRATITKADVLSVFHSNVEDYIEKYKKDSTFNKEDI